MNDAFKKHLVKSGMTMYQLSAKTGIPYTTINKLIGRINAASTV